MADPSETKDGASAAKPESEKQRIKFDYLKSPSFRTAHIDGVIGGPTPDGRKIYFGLFSERAPIPTQVTHEMARVGDTDTLRLGDEIAELRIQRDAVVRELEVGLVMDLTAASILHKWLGEKLALLTKAKDQRAEAVKAMASAQEEK